MTKKPRKKQFGIGTHFQAQKGGFWVFVEKIRTGNDRTFPCLRLADLFAGLTRARFDDRDNQKAKKLYDLAEIKITTQLMGGQAFQVSRP